MKITEIEEALKIGSTTLQGDIRAFILHLRGVLEVKAVDGIPAYQLSDAAYANREAIRAILTTLQDEHGYRPRKSALESVQRPVEQALGDGRRMIAEKGQAAREETTVTNKTSPGSGSAHQLDLFDEQSTVAPPMQPFSSSAADVEFDKDFRHP